jgi:hypothetical protein
VNLHKFVATEAAAFATQGDLKVTIVASHDLFEQWERLFELPLERISHVHFIHAAPEPTGRLYIVEVHNPWFSEDDFGEIEVRQVKVGNWG